MSLTPTCRNSVGLAVLVAAVSLVLPSTRAMAAYVTWVGPGLLDGWFNDPSNWSPQRVPTGTDTARFTACCTHYYVHYPASGGYSHQGLEVQGSYVSLMPQTGTGAPFAYDVDTINVFDGRLAIGALAIPGASLLVSGVNGPTFELYYKTALTCSSTIIGDAAGQSGAVHAYQALTWNPGLTLVGNEGSGELTLEQPGGTGPTLNTTSNVYIGYETYAVGTVTVDGSASSLQCGDLYVGRWGKGTLTVTGGADVVSDNGFISCWWYGGSHPTWPMEGHVLIDGAGSSWTMAGSLEMADYGAVWLTISDGGHLSCGECPYTSLNGGSLCLVTGEGSSWDVNGDMYLGGSYITASGSSLVTIADGAELAVTGTLTVRDRLVLDGGTVEALTVTVPGGDVIPPLPCVAGVGTVDADLNVVEWGELHRDGSGALIVTGDYSQGGHATLQFEIDSSPANHHGQVEIAGAANLGATLRIVADGYAPQPGQTYTVLTAAGGVNDEFDEVIGPHMSIVYTATEVLLTTTYFGDASQDGSVDGADYTLWADHYEQSGGWTDGDFNGDGWVDGADYTLWADNYEAGGGSSVPEPATPALLILGGLALIRRRRTGGR